MDNKEIRKAYNQANELKGPPNNMELIGVLFESYLDITVYKDCQGNYWYSEYYVGD